MDVSIGIIFGLLIVAMMLAIAFLSLIFKIEGLAKWLLGYEAILDIIFSLSIFGLVGSTAGLFVVAFAAVVFTVFISIAHEAYGDKTMRIDRPHLYVQIKNYLWGREVAWSESFIVTETDGVGLIPAIKSRVRSFFVFLWRVVR